MCKQINDCKKGDLAAQDKKNRIVKRIHLHIKMGSGPGDDTIYDQLAHPHDSSEQCGMEGSCAPFDIVLCDQKQKISKQIQKHIQPFDVKKGYGTQAGIQKAQHDKPVGQGAFRRK